VIAPRSPIRWLVISAIAMIVLQQSLSAAVVLRKGATEPVMGYLVRSDDTTVVLREPQPKGPPREHTFRRDEIDELLITVSPERLASLDPADPKLYREYAEELAEKRRDPEASDAARRLFAIAAFHASGAERKSALLGLAALAQGEAEDRRLRAAAYLHDPAHPKSLLAPAAETKLAETKAEPAALSAVLAALRSLRNGRPSEAKAALASPVARQPLAALESIVTPAELAAACKENMLSDASLRKVLLAELALQRALGEATVKAAPASAPAPWSEALRSAGSALLPSLDIDRLTEFDPRESVFNGGKWARP
jgi:hypothetical protein